MLKVSKRLQDWKGPSSPVCALNKLVLTESRGCCSVAKGQRQRETCLSCWTLHGLPEDKKLLLRRQMILRGASPVCGKDVELMWGLLEWRTTKGQSANLETPAAWLPCRVSRLPVTQMHWSMRSWGCLRVLCSDQHVIGGILCWRKPWTRNQPSGTEPKSNDRLRTGAVEPCCLTLL